MKIKKGDYVFLNRLKGVYKVIDFRNSGKSVVLISPKDPADKIGNGRNYDLNKNITLCPIQKGDILEMLNGSIYEVIGLYRKGNKNFVRYLVHNNGTTITAELSFVMLNFVKFM